MAKNTPGVQICTRVQIAQMNEAKDNIYIRFCTKLYRQIVGIPMGPLEADSFLFCYERDFMLTVLVSEFR